MQETMTMKIMRMRKIDLGLSLSLII